MACCSGSALRVPQMHHSTVAASHKQGTPIRPLSDAHADITAPVKPFATPQRTRTSFYTLQLQAQQEVQLVPHVSTVASLHRRLALELAAGALLQPLAALQQPCAAYAAQPSSPQQVQVGPSQQYTTITAAIAAAPSGATICIDPGRYNERLLIQKSLKLVAAQQSGGASVEVFVDTQEPYQHCLEVSTEPGDTQQPLEVQVEGLTFKHYSKSVANNYCVFAQSGRLIIKSCDISSRSGVGVGVEGAEVVLQDCTIHDCERHGVAVFGSLEGGLGTCSITSSSISFNKLNGLLARDGASVTMQGSLVSGNGEYGMQLQDCTVKVTTSKFIGNRYGAVLVQLETVDVDIQQMEQGNELDGPVKLI